MIIAQLTDIHVTAPGTMAYDVVDTESHLRRAIARVNRLAPSPDLVMISGDLIDVGNDEEYAHLQTLLSQLSAPCLLTIGNHDNRDLFLDRFATSDFLPSEGRLDGFAQYVVDLPDWRLMVLDTHTPGLPYGSLCERRLQWIDNELAREPKKSVFIFMHHPPFETGIWWMDAIRLHGASQLEAIVAKHRNVVRISCGHVHRSVQTEWAGVPSSICPGVAHCTTLDLAGDDFLMMAMEPPGFQLHLLTPGGAVVTHTCPVDDNGQTFLPSNRIVDSRDAYLNKYKSLFQQAGLSNGKTEH